MIPVDLKAFFSAFIFNVQIGIASGPTLLGEEIDKSRALVPISQAAAQEETASSSWWRLIS